MFRFIRNVVTYEISLPVWTLLLCDIVGQLIVNAIKGLVFP